MVDENGAAVILKDNKPRYILMEYSQLKKEEILHHEVDNKVIALKLKQEAVLVHTRDEKSKQEILKI